MRAKVCVNSGAMKSFLRLLPLLAAMGCAACQMFHPWAEYPNGTAMYPGAYRLEWARLHDPNHKLTWYEKNIEGTGCSEPLDARDQCPSGNGTGS